MKVLSVVITSVILLGIWCEVFVYYFVLYQCSWPTLRDNNHDSSQVLKSMFVADTHLLGPYRGHWFDKLRREWQMYRAFQSALTIFEPDVVFFLGDIFDEGLWVSKEAFEDYVNRFQSLFKVHENMKVFVVPGNHDMGFHYVLTPYLNSRFNEAFNTSSIKAVQLKGSNFILINSMAMHEDNCFLCQAATRRINNLGEKLTCKKDPNRKECSGKNISSDSVPYSQPIILQHFPMYRESDMNCTGVDAPPLTEKSKLFREKWECLSKQSTEFLLTTLEPRLILSGHTHHGCLVEHNISSLNEPTPEHSVPSFSWRNRNNPSFMLGIFTKDHFYLEKCFLPQETTIIIKYILGAVAILVVAMISVYSYILRRFRKKYS